jgi:hypothetical protein
MVMLMRRRRRNNFLAVDMADDNSNNMAVDHLHEIPKKGAPELPGAPNRNHCRRVSGPVRTIGM